MTTLILAVICIERTHRSRQNFKEMKRAVLIGSRMLYNNRELLEQFLKDINDQKQPDFDRDEFLEKYRAGTGMSRSGASTDLDLQLEIMSRMTQIAENYIYLDEYRDKARSEIKISPSI